MLQIVFVIIVDRGRRRTAAISGCWDGVSRTGALTPSSGRTGDDTSSTPPRAHSPPTDVSHRSLY